MIISTEKRISATNVKELEKELLSLVNTSKDIVINMENTSYIGSVALRLILITVKARDKNNLSKIKLINVASTIRETLESTGYDRFIDIE